MKPKTLSIFSLSFTILIAMVVLISSCGKKDETVPTVDTSKTNQQQTIQQNTQQQNTQQQTQENVKKMDSIAAENKKKDDEAQKKKDAEEKKKKEEVKKEEEKKVKDVGGVDFSTIWPKKCAKCHGMDGKGKLEGVPNLTDSKTKGKSTDALKKIITNGKKAETEDGENMPSFKGKLTDEEIDAAAKYVKGL
jgi:mono/diheme cytochrome c family protein